MLGYTGHRRQGNEQLTVTAHLGEKLGGVGGYDQYECLNDQAGVGAADHGLKTGQMLADGVGSGMMGQPVRNA